MWLLHGHGNWLFDIIEQGLKLGCLGAFPAKVKVKDFGVGYFRTHAHSVRAVAQLVQFGWWLCRHYCEAGRLLVLSVCTEYRRLYI